MARTQRAKNKQHRKQAAKKKAEAQRKERIKQVGSQPQTSFRCEYENPGSMALVGPLLTAVWTVPGVLAAELEAAGQPIPEPVSGEMLIDTGASRTCISMEAAAQLNLRALRLAQGYGAGGKHELPVYRAHLTIHILNRHGVTSLSWPTEAQGIPNLEESIAKLGVAQVGPDGKSGRNAKLVGLLGRDVLRHAVVTYDGPRGCFEVKFDLGGLREAGTYGQLNPQHR